MYINASLIFLQFKILKDWLQYFWSRPCILELYTWTKYLKINTVKPVLSGHLKIDKTMVLKTNGSLMKVESIAECSLGAFCNTFDLH